MLVARTGNVEAAKLLIDRGATVDAREGFGGQTALMWASARRHPAMIDFLISRGAAIDARSAVRDYQRHVQAEGRPKSLDTGGFTPLLYAARENCIACVDVLLAKGADIDLPDPDGVSPVHVAIMNANWDLAKRLIEAGADVNQWDIFGEAPLFTAVGARARTGNSGASIDATQRDGRADDRPHAARARREPEHAALLPARERARRHEHARLDAVDPSRDEQRLRGREAAARAWRRRDDLHGRPPNADPCRARGPRLGEGRARVDRACCTRRARTSTPSLSSFTWRKCAAARRCTTPCANATRKSFACWRRTAST